MKLVAYILVVLVGLGGSARAESKRKATPDKITKAASKAFKDAMTAEDKGDLETAANLYEKAFKISPHAATAFNLAEINVQRDDLLDAVAAYQLYLGLAPAAPDRKELEALIGELLRRPGTIQLYWLASDPFDHTESYVLIDGDIVLRPGDAVKVETVGKRSQLAFPARPGEHLVEIVTPISYDAAAVDVPIGRSVTRKIALPPRVDGNLIASAPHPITIDVGTRSVKINGERLVAPVGTYLLGVDDGSPARECPPVSITTPRAGELAYVHIMPAELPKLPLQHAPRRCRKLVTKRHRLVFP
ncbi:MAG: hypothetical protein H0T89_06010 [Deltaproteobacteria bacterium]|nr:hypothetical protein [Deltaproteobacteria bacterium]MDQ3296941.1 tetratricopeptide repeat protein [Myxococcota bacterium]